MLLGHMEIPWNQQFKVFIVSERKSSYLTCYLNVDLTADRSLKTLVSASRTLSIPFFKISVFFFFSI